MCKGGRHGTFRKIILASKEGCISQEQLAQQLGVSRQAMSKRELGKAIPESDTLI